MAIRRVLIIGDEMLRKVSKKVESFDDRLVVLLNDMYETLLAQKGAGLSAVQVGCLKRVFIMNLDSGLVEVINPEIVEESKKRCIQLEGCLSVPGKSSKVERPYEVTLKYQDRFGKVNTRKFKDYEARCICHENDHLNGILYVDKVIVENTKKKKENK